MRGLHLLFCPAPGGHQPPSGGSPLSPAPWRRPRCPPASCLGSSPSAPGPGRSSTRWCSQRSSSEAATRRPTAAGCRVRWRPQLPEGAAKNGGAPRVAAFGGRLLVDTWHYCQPRFHQRLQLASAANPATLYYVKARTHLCDTFPADRIKGSSGSLKQVKGSLE